MLNPHCGFNFIAVIAVHFECTGDSSSASVFSTCFVLKGFSHHILRLWTTWTLSFIKLSITLCGLLTLPYISETTKDLSGNILFLWVIFLLLIGFSNQMSIYNQISCSSWDFILILWYLIRYILIIRHLLLSFIVSSRLSSAFKVGLWVTNYTLASIASINVFAPQYQFVRWTLRFIPWRYGSFIFTLPWLFRLMGLLWPYLFLSLFFLLLLFFFFFLYFLLGVLLY